MPPSCQRDSLMLLIPSSQDVFPTAHRLRISSFWTDDSLLFSWPISHRTPFPGPPALLVRATQRKRGWISSPSSVLLLLQGILLRAMAALTWHIERESLVCSSNAPGLQGEGKGRGRDTAFLPCIIHKFAQNLLLLLCDKVFWIFAFKTLFFMKSLKPGRIVQNL